MYVLNFICVMQRAREAAVIVQAESDTGKASMHDAGGRGAQSVRSSGIGRSPGQNCNRSCTRLLDPSTPVAAFGGWK